MRKWLKVAAWIALGAVLLTGCAGPLRKPQSSQQPPPAQTPAPGVSASNSPADNSGAKFYRQGDPNVKKIALTFDDGPDALWTPQILDVLRDKQVKATFFLIGKEVDKYPDVARRIAAEGHVIGNHTYDHLDLNRLPPEKMTDEIQRGNDAISRAAHVIPRLLRPPAGAEDPQAINVAAQNGMFVILWSVDTEDWRGLDAATVKTRALKPAKNGSIILQHSGEGPHLTGTVEALPQIIDTLQSQGYTLVTVPELLNLPAYK